MKRSISLAAQPSGDKCGDHAKADFELLPNSVSEETAHGQSAKADFVLLSG
jgi:hypothetical protein